VLCVGFFDIFDSNWVDNTDSILIQGGSPLTDEADEPIMIKDRGIYFDGVDDTLLIEASRFMLNISFTIQTWVWPETDTGTLFSINKPNPTSVGAEDFVTYAITASIPVIRFKQDA
jgi:hypothetical protein